MKKNSFRFLVLGVLLLNFFDLGFSVVFENQNVLKVEDYIKSIESPSSDAIKLLESLAYLIFGLLAYTVSMCGLIFFQSWARILFALVFIIKIPFYVIQGVSVSGPLGSFMYDLISWGHGAILALLFLSPVKELYLKRGS